VRDDHVPRRVGARVVGAQHAAARGRHAERAEQLGLGPRHPHRARRVAAAEHRVARDPLVGGEALERAVALAEVLHHAGAERPAVVGAVAPARVDDGEAVRVAVRQRVEEHRLDDAEHRRVRADA
jgi:hypothetical protein